MLVYSSRNSRVGANSISAPVYLAVQRQLSSATSSSSPSLCCKASSDNSKSKTHLSEGINELESLRNENKVIKTDLKRAKELLLFRLAEIDNNRKQAERDIQNAKHYGISAFGLEMCNVILFDLFYFCSKLILYFYFNYTLLLTHLSCKMCGYIVVMDGGKIIFLLYKNVYSFIF